jgi:nanoRNase/pAp phosphatase (c-di-AMP/oligoRNAs hydrolase)
MKKNPAECLLTGIVAHYENFKNLSTSPKTLKIAAQLMEQGANYQKITEQLYTTTKQQMDFLTEIFKHLNNENGLYVAALQSQEFSDFGEGQAKEAMTKIKRLGLQNNLLVLWEIHDSEPMTKGFFYSKNPDTLHAIHGKMNNGWVFLEMPGEDILTAKETILKLL